MQTSFYCFSGRGKPSANGTLVLHEGCRRTIGGGRAHTWAGLPEGAWASGPLPNTCRRRKTKRRKFRGTTVSACHIRK